MLSLLLLLSSAAWAQELPRVYLTAAVEPNLQVISGEIRLAQPDSVRLVDVLAQLPLPTDDLSAHRTWPGAPEEGHLSIDDRGEGRFHFYAILPRRYDAAGMVPGRGLYANGLWHPQPIAGSDTAAVQWEAEVRIPEGAVGALNTSAGEDVLRWSGPSERLSLAVVPDGHLRELPTGAGRLRVLDDRPERRHLDDHLAEVLEDIWPGPMAPDVLIVVTPSRRRLARPGAGVLYLSDRTFRLSGPLWRYHIQAVRLGLLEACLPIADAWLRRLAAGAVVEAAPDPPTADRALGWFSWIPQIDALLYDGQLPFYSDVFGEVWPADPVADDLQEIVQRRAPGRAVARRIDSIYGEGSALRLARSLIAGNRLHEATVTAGVPPVAIRDWQGWPADQDLSVEVEQSGDGHWQARIRREAPPDAPLEPVILDVDGIRQRVLLGPGADAQTVALPRKPDVVRLDPEGSLRQTTPANDRWPDRWTTIFYLSPDELNVAQRRFSGSLNLALRKQYNTRWRYGLGLYTDPQNTAGGTLSLYRSFGPLMDRRSRPLGVWMGLGGALLDPDFRPTDSGQLAVEGFGGVDYDTRYVNNLARRGYRVALSGGAGQVLESESRWGSGQLSLQGRAPVGGRVTLAGRAKGGLASGEVEHRLLRLGGTGAVQGLPFDAAVGTQRVITSAEVRWLPVKQAAVPLPLMWLSELQLSGGVDAGGVRDVEGELQTALGWSAGVAAVADILGADPNFGGLWFAGPIDGDGSFSIRDELQLYIRISQTF